MKAPNEYSNKKKKNFVNSDLPNSSTTKKSLPFLFSINLYIILLKLWKLILQNVSALSRKYNKYLHFVVILFFVTFTYVYKLYLRRFFQNIVPKSVILQIILCILAN